MKVQLDRRAEWKQIYGECWRQMRDFLYAPNMQGVDWPQKRARYEPLLPYVDHRADLTYVIGEMIGELNIGHAYVGGGDYPKPATDPHRACSARKVERDPASGYLPHHADPQGRELGPETPLAADRDRRQRQAGRLHPGRRRQADQQDDEHLRRAGRYGRQAGHAAGQFPSRMTDGSHETVVVPTADEQPLYYLNWVRGNIERVSKATGGKVAYVHVPDMGPEG